MKLQDNDLKNKYTDLSDGELFERLNDGDEGVIEFLLDKYKNLVRSKANSMNILGADTDDLIQEGMIGLFKAIKDYDPGRDASFFTFATLCVTRKMYSAVKAYGRDKNIPLNSYTSIYSSITDDDGNETNVSLGETLSNSGDENPEAVIIARETVDTIMNWIETELSSFEKEALELYLTGLNYVQIAKVLGRDEKSTDNALNRAKNKIKKLLDESRKREDI